MNKIKSIALLATLALSTALPLGNAIAAGGTVTPHVAYVDGSSIHVEGEATTGTLAASIEVYLGDTLVAGPENTNTTVSGTTTSFSYNVAGNFDASKTYKVCTADFDGGALACINTVKLIKSVEITVKPPKIGETVTLVDQGGWDWPDKEPSASISGDTYELDMAVWDKDGTGAEFFEGTFEANTNYYAFMDLVAKDGYIFSSDPTVKIKGGGVLSDSEVWPGANGMAIIVKIKANETGEVEDASVAAGDTGTAPTATEDTAGKATQNISLGVSIIIAVAILYGAHLIINKKSTRN